METNGRPCELRYDFKEASSAAVLSGVAFGFAVGFEVACTVGFEVGVSAEGA
ncbi:MAG: hypothetical protein MUO70_08915 [Euryarchaeota archaeon]|jgi:hypothetical protein|nr:hypothetical protein [Euryarchaeota archaeon]